MRSLWLISIGLSLLFLSACSPYPKLEKVSQEEMTIKSPFPLLGTDYNYWLFRTSMDFRQQHFSGLLVIKRLSTDNYRTILTNELGVKLFDFGVDKGKFEAYYVMEEMNRPMILEPIRKDMQLLLQQASEGDKSYFKGQENGLEKNVVCTEWEQGIGCYVHSLPQQTISRVEYIKGRKRKIIIKPTDTGEVDELHISHPGQQLEVQLNLLEKK